MKTSNLKSIRNWSYYYLIDRSNISGRPNLVLPDDNNDKKFFLTPSVGYHSL